MTIRVQVMKKYFVTCHGSVGASYTGKITFFLKLRDKSKGEGKRCRDGGCSKIWISYSLHHGFLCANVL